MSELKILQLNAWGGRIKDGLTRFIAEGGYDVVCLQEAIWGGEEGFLTGFIDTVDKIKDTAGFKHDFRSSNFGFTVLDGIQCESGNVILSRIPFEKTEELLVCGDYQVANNEKNYEAALYNHRYTAQKVTLGGGLVVMNYHGYWLKDPLGDEASTRCMEVVAEALKNESLPVVMCGDLNVIADAPCMRELDFLTDLTKVNQIKTTLRNVRFVKDVACDHILVSKGLKYRDFKVVSAPVSDHCALSITVAF